MSAIYSVMLRYILTVGIMIMKNIRDKSDEHCYKEEIKYCLHNDIQFALKAQMHLYVIPQQFWYKKRKHAVFELPLNQYLHLHIYYLKNNTAFLYIQKNNNL